jgi:hypothetical protein
MSFELKEFRMRAYHELDIIIVHIKIGEVAAADPPEFLSPWNLRRGSRPVFPNTAAKGIWK